MRTNDRHGHQRGPRGASEASNNRCSAGKAEADKTPQTETERECITKDDVENPFQSKTENCTQTIVTTTRTTQELRLACTGDVKGTGVMRITTPIPESMTAVLDLQMGQDADVLTMKGQYKGRWLGADCGDESDEGDEGDEGDG